MHLYSYSSPEVMANFTVANYMPLDAPDEWKGALSGAMGMMYNSDREFFSRVVHVNLSGVMAIACIINL